MLFIRWFHKLWYIQKMEYYSVVKRNKLSAMKRQGRTLNVFNLSEKKSIWKDSYTIWFKLNDTVEKGKLKILRKCDFQEWTWRSILLCHLTVNTRWHQIQTFSEIFTSLKWKFLVGYCKYGYVICQICSDLQNI